MILRRFHPVWVRRERLLDFLYVFSDAIALALAFVVMYQYRFEHSWVHKLLTRFPFVQFQTVGAPPSEGWLLRRVLYWFLLALFFYATYSYLGLYRGYRRLRRPHYIRQIFAVNLVAFGGSILFFYVTRNTTVPRSILPFLFLSNALITYLLRFALRKTMRAVRHVTRLFNSPVLVIGKTAHARDLCEFIDRYHPHGMFVEEHVGSHAARELDAVRQTIRQRHIRCVLLADKSMPLDVVMDIIELTAELQNVSCIVVSNRLTVLPMKAGVPCSTVRGVPCVYFDALHSVFKEAWWRQLFSRALALASLFVLSPFLLGVAIAIKLTSPGPVFFRQKRYGINQRSFLMYKFRTMCENAEDKLAALENQNEMGKGGLFKIKDDPRITSIGHFLRRYSIDELPQLINVVKGDMRIVGPRPLPERDFRNYYKDWHYGRHLGAPGLTCLWQISGRSDMDFQTMCILDLYYIRNNSWALDLSIILHTVTVIFNGSGAY